MRSFRRSVSSVLCALLPLSSAQAATVSINPGGSASGVPSGQVAAPVVDNPLSPSLPSDLSLAPSDLNTPAPASRLEAAPAALAAQVSLAPAAVEAAVPAIEETVRVRLVRGQGSDDRSASPLPAPGPLPERLAAMSERVSDESRAAREEGPDGSRAAADRQFGLLTGERLRAADDEAAGSDAGADAPAQPLLRAPQLASGEAERLRDLNAQVEATAREALRPFFPSGRFSLRSRGSTTRLTHVGKVADFDLAVAVPEGWDAKTITRFLDRKGPSKALHASLERSFSRLGGQLFPESRLDVGISRRKSLKRPVLTEVGNIFHELDPSAKLLTVTLRDQDSRKVLLKADLLFTNNPAYLNAYPERFARQLAEVERAGGPGAVDAMLGDIRLAKSLFQRVVRAYKAYHGGPSGVGVEQMVLQSGGFERMLLNVLRAAYTPSGKKRAWNAAAQSWAVENPFAGPPNFVQLLSPEAWTRLVFAAQRYFELRERGKPFALGALAPPDLKLSRRLPSALRPLLKDDPGPIGARPVQAEGQAIGALTLDLLNRFTVRGPAPVERGPAFLLAQGAQVLPEGLATAADEQVFPPVPGAAGQAAVGIIVRKGRFVSLQSLADPAAKPTDFPEELARGTVSGTIVEVRYGERETVVRRVGARPQDMAVGRLRRMDGKWMLVPLLKERGDDLTLYGPVPVENPGDAQDGAIVQAFVSQEGPETRATVLIDLGRKLTPEIAAREIALRRGARGYMPKEVIKQAEARVSRDGPEAEFERIRAAVRGTDLPEPVDLRGEPFITMDPPGAGDLDDAFHIRREADGGYTWRLATALIGHYVQPGSPAFREAARIGNTFYSPDKEGVPEYPMNQPAISKYGASLLPGKDNLAMITTMRFDRDGKLIMEKSGVTLGLMRVEGRYSYDQVRDYWKKKADHGVAHGEAIDLARELAAKLRQADLDRGKLDFDFDRADYVKADGEWKVVVEEKDPLLAESHGLIEELKTNGNHVIAALLESITLRHKVPHISRMHPPQTQAKKNDQLHQLLAQIGLPWKPEETLSAYLDRVNGMKDVPRRKRQVAMLMALRTRNRASYGVLDVAGHEGLAFKPGEYDHPSAGIRRFADMYNLTLLDAYLRGDSPARAYAAVMADLKALGFESLDEFTAHLNQREEAADQMEREIGRFMSAWELAKPQYRGRTLSGYVKSKGMGKSKRVVIQLEDPYVVLVLDGGEAAGFALAQPVKVTIRGVDLAAMDVQFDLKR